MKRAGIKSQTKLRLSTKFIYLSGAAFLVAVFVIVLIYLNSNSHNAKAAINTYQFSSGDASYSSFSDGTVLGNTSNDEQVYTAKSIGFTFNYGGTDYSTVSIASNGFIAMGNSVASSSLPISGGSTNNIIAALGADLQAQSGASLRYKTTGTAPNRVFIVQWTNYRLKSGSGFQYNFQIKLYETSNIVQVVYGNFDVPSSLFTTYEVEVGLRGASNSIYNNRSTSNNWSSTSAGAANTATCVLWKWSSFFGTFTVLPSSGLSFSWTPESAGNTWLGFTEDWEDDANWSSSAPSSSIDATIPTSPIGGNFPSITANGNSVRNLTISSGATLTVASGKTLTVSGNLLNEGSSSTGSGEVLVSSNVLQWVKGKVGNLNVNKGGSEITLNNDIEVLGTLKLTKGALNLNGKKLTLSGNVNSSNGTITGSNTSDLTITGSGNLGTLTFTSGSQSLRNFTVNRSGTLTLGSDLTVSNQLILTNGTVQTGSNYLIVNNTDPASITGYGITSYVVGNLRRYINATGSYDLPIGTTSDYQFASINFNASSGITYIDAKFTTTPTTQPNVVIDYVQFAELLDNGYWTISPNAVVSANYDLTVVARGQTNGGTSSDQLTLLKRHDSSFAWASEGTYDVSWNSGYGTDPITLTRKGLTTFSDYSGAPSTGGMLPVEFVSFKGWLENKAVQLNWSTVSETNNDHFEVERSTDGVEFSSIAQVKGNGNTVSQNDYEYIDQNLLSSTYYYRIKQVDFNSSFSYSDIIIVKAEHLQPKHELTVEIFPNPTTFDNINLKIESPDQSNDYEVSILGVDGNIIHQQKIKFTEISDGVIHLNLTSPILPKTYLLKVQQQNQSVIKQIIIKD